jgi:F0F1-type ATP synthase assembly protein I
LAVIIFNFPLFLILILLLGLFDPLINLRKKNV